MEKKSNYIHQTMEVNNTPGNKNYINYFVDWFMKFDNEKLENF